MNWLTHEKNLHINIDAIDTITIESQSEGLLVLLYVPSGRHAFRFATRKEADAFVARVMGSEATKPVAKRGAKRK